MATHDGVGGGGGDGGRTNGDGPARKLRISPRWLKTTVESNRLAFEDEMQRHRQRFDRELRRFWRTRDSTT